MNKNLEQGLSWGRPERPDSPVYHQDNHTVYRSRDEILYKTLNDFISSGILKFRTIQFRDRYIELSGLEDADYSKIYFKCYEFLKHSYLVKRVDRGTFAIRYTGEFNGTSNPDSV